MCEIDAQSIYTGLCSHTKLERDGGLEKLNQLLSSNTETPLLQLQADILHTLANQEASWESLHGCLCAARLLIDRKKNLSAGGDTNNLCNLALQLLEHIEARVRLAAGELLGAQCRAEGVLVFTQCRCRVESLIRDNLERRVSADDAQQNAVLVDKLVASHHSDADLQGADAAKIFHDTAGWKALETSMKCLQLMVEGCGPAIVPHLNRPLVDLVFQSLTHTNRFVRESGFYLLGSIVSCATGVEGDENSGLAPSTIVEIAKWLEAGLGDNWSQVRLAASVATRNFVTNYINKSAVNASHEQCKKECMRAMVPPMCINRYYLAEGVRLYSQHTWKMLGCGAVDSLSIAVEYIEPIAIYYVLQTKADNHAVREAACHAIAELAVKIPSDKLASHVAKLLEALVACFDDESWPVRDGACIASARFLAAFPDSGRDKLHQLMPFFWRQLHDCIPSVRQGAADSLSRLFAIYKQEVAEWIWPKLEDGLKKVESQPADDEGQQLSEHFTGLDPAPAVFGVAKRIRANDADIHTGQQMYSCGSLAPKMGRSGCSDHSFTREAAPWEVTDGCVQLLADLCTMDSEMRQKIGALMPLLFAAGKKRDYVQHVQLLETVCKRLPQMARGFTPRFFKPHLQNSLDLLKYALLCGCQLTEVAAEECLKDFAKIFGPSIIRGRIEMLENYDRFLDKYDQIVAMKM